MITCLNVGCLPDGATDLNRGLTAEIVGKETRHQRAEPGAARHGGGDSTLDVGRRATAFTGVVEAQSVELALVGIGADDFTHRRDIKTKKATADDSGGGDEVDVADLGSHIGQCGVGKDDFSLSQGVPEEEAEEGRARLPLYNFQGSSARPHT